ESAGEMMRHHADDPCPVVDRRFATELPERTDSPEWGGEGIRKRLLLHLDVVATGQPQLDSRQLAALVGGYLADATRSDDRAEQPPVIVFTGEDGGEFAARGAERHPGQLRTGVHA